MLNLPKLKWLSSFDFKVPIGEKLFSVPGNQIHINLQHYENKFRAHLANYDQLISLQREITKLRQNKFLLENMRNTRGNPADKVADAAVKIISSIYQSKTGKLLKPYRLDFAEAIKLVIAKFDTQIEFATIKDQLSCTLAQTSLNFSQYFINSYSLNTTPFYAANWQNTNVSDVIKFFLKDLAVLSKHIMVDLSEIIKLAKSRVTARKGKVPQKVKTAISGYNNARKNYSETIPQCEKKLIDKREQLDRLSAKTKNFKPTQKTRATNFVIAQIGFVITLVDNQKPQFVSFPITVKNRNVHDLYDAFDDKFTKYFYTQGGKKFLRNTLIDSSILRKQDFARKKIDEEMKKSTYNEDYYHSEQNLFVYLEKPENIWRILSRLQRELGGGKIEQIYHLVLDLHSTNYMCKKCQIATIYMQKQQHGFLKSLQALAEKHFNFIKNYMPIKMITRVSADVPFPKSSDKVNLQNHQLFEKNDLNSENIIFAMDSNELNLQKEDRVSQKLVDEFKCGLHKHSILSSGGRSKKAQDLALSYNHTVLEVRKKAAQTIWNFWKEHKAQLERNKLENVVVKNTSKHFVERI